jgi:endoglucanase
MKILPLTLCAALLAFNLPAAEKTFAFTPTNPPAMQPIAAHDTPAYRAAKLFLHGANLGNYLEAPPHQSWGVTFAPDEAVAMKREGFDHIRVPVGWHHYAGPAPEYALSPEIFAKVDFVVTNLLANRLAVMINIHHFRELDANPANAAAEFVALWRQIAAHYRGFPPQLAFELDNEPHDAATTALMNPLYAQAIAEIRKSNPQRTIFVEPGKWGSVDELKNLVLPPDDNVIVSVHCYEPFNFTHQGATWAGEDVKQLKNIQFPGPPATPLVIGTNVPLARWVRGWIHNYNTLPADKNPSGPAAFAGLLRYAHDWSDYYGRPVHVGEFGAFTTADEQSRANFYRAFRRTAEAEQLGWCIWDWSAGFRYWDKKHNCAMPLLHAALFDQ